MVAALAATDGARIEEDRALPGLLRQRLRDADVQARRNTKPGLCHPQRAEQRVVEDALQIATAGDLEDVAEDIGRVAVVPDAARLVLER